MFFKVLTIFLISFSFVADSFSSDELSDSEFQDIIDEIATLTNKPVFDPYDSGRFAKERQHEMSRARKALKIARNICPKNALEAYDSPLPVENFDPLKVQVEATKKRLLNRLLVTIENEKNTVILEAIGRLCIVGFNFIDKGSNLLISCGDEGIRTLCFALRDIGKPYDIRHYLRYYDSNQSNTCNHFMIGELSQLTKSQTEEASALRRQMEMTGLIEKSELTETPIDSYSSNDRDVSNNKNEDYDSEHDQ